MGYKKGLSNNHVRTIIEDKNNNLWMGTEGGGINKFDRKTQTIIIFGNYSKIGMEIFGWLHLEED
ncbi:MAG: hypothetical protein B6I24_07460 [Bacteroidetes bacterium 4572_128]|nr:MAG: hypothetical protein B6I24_07460 [Bacteroidetes bacterium 4572_128]